MNMKAVVSSILEKATRGHSLALAVSYFLRYDKYHSNPTLCSSPIEIISNLLKSFHISYSASATFQMTHRFKLYRPLSIGHRAPHCMSMGIPQRYLLTIVFPPCTEHRTCSLRKSDLGWNPPLPALFSIFCGTYGTGPNVLANNRRNWHVNFIVSGLKVAKTRFQTFFRGKNVLFRWKCQIREFHAHGMERGEVFEKVLCVTKRGYAFETSTKR